MTNNFFADTSSASGAVEEMEDDDDDDDNEDDGDEDDYVDDDEMEDEANDFHRILAVGGDLQGQAGAALNQLLVSLRPRAIIILPGSCHPCPVGHVAQRAIRQIVGNR